MTEEMLYTEEDDKNTLEVFSEPISPNRNVGDCCQIAKDTWMETVNRLIGGINNSRAQELETILNPSNLDCRSFYNLLKELRLLSTTSDVIGNTNNVVGRYMRLNKVTTSLLGSVANVAKSAGVEALTAWVKCKEMKGDEPDEEWQNVLRRNWQ